MGDGARFSLGLRTGEGGRTPDVSTGEGARPRLRVQGEVALLTGEGARRNLGLVAGDSARASS